MDRGHDSVDAIKVPSHATDHGEDHGEDHADANAHSHSFKYNMKHQNIGQCIIINNKNFDKKTGMGVRNGTDMDAKSTSEVFSNLGFRITVKNDLTVSQMKNFLTEVSQKDHSQSAMFVCVLLSHGDEGLIYGTDGAMKLNDVFKLFRGDHCSTLVGKPKLFFIQACRGHNLDSGVETDSVEESNEGQKIPVEADFLYAFSTAPGYYSWRNVCKGSWFITSLCDMLSRYSKELEILRIMTRVNHQVALDFKSSSNLPGFDGMKQIPCIMSMLTKELYFPK